MRSWLAVAVSVVNAGCVLSAGGGGGAVVSHGGVAGEATMSLAYGIGSNTDATLTRFQTRVGADHFIIAGGPELDGPFVRLPHPVGYRLRAEGGGYVSVSSTTASSALMLGAVPGVFWIPFHTEASPHALALALEMPLEFRLGVDDDPHVRPIVGLMLSAEWVWTPCTLFGGASCSCGGNAEAACPPPHK
jgi:hypothetical protein